MNIPGEVFSLNERAGAIKIEHLDEDIFPFKAFEFEDPNENATPFLKLKGPWDLQLASGFLYLTSTEHLKWHSTYNKFYFSDDLIVDGTLHTTGSAIRMNHSGLVFTNADGSLYFANDALLGWDESGDHFHFSKRLECQGGSGADLTANTGYVIVGNSAGQHLAIDYSKILSKSDGTTAETLYLQNAGVVAGGETIAMFANLDGYAYIGRAFVGYDGTNDVAAFGHLDCRSTSNFALEQGSAGATVLNAKTGQAIYLSINDSPIATVNSSGIEVSSDLYLKLTSVGNWSDCLQMYDGSDYTQITMDNNDAGRLLVRVDGAGGVKLTSGAAAWAAVSDIRAKKNVTTLDGVLDKFDQIRGVSFNWADEYWGDTRKRQIGLLTQDVERVFPEAVVKGSIGKHSVDPLDKAGFDSIMYTMMIPPIVQAIKELKEGLDELRYHAGIA